MSGQQRRERSGQEWKWGVLLGVALGACLAESSCADAATPPRPNIVFILTDDLGYGDIGVFYQNARRALDNPAAPTHLTPHLDALAESGVQLRDHYCSAPVCAPSRASLMLGVHQGHANVRDNQFDKMLEDNHTVASVLKTAGYATAAFGKWGLQGGPGKKDPATTPQGPSRWPGYPTKRGFDFYFGYVRHGDGHAHYPHEDGKEVWENEREVSADLAGCYTADLFTARTKQWIIDQRQASPSQPFFCYLAYDTPHAKTQYPPRAYPAGGGRQGGLQWMGQSGQMINAADGRPDSWCHPDYASATWDHDDNSATPVQPWPDVFRRYATSIRRLDDCVGDLVQLLKDLEIDDETLVVFTSDNGVSLESYLKEDFSPQFFRSFGPFDGVKRDCWEGGVRVGAVASWPGVVPAGQINTDPTAHYDWLATFAELSGMLPPARSDGVSLVPVLMGQAFERPEPIYIEYSQNGKTPNFPEFDPSHRGRKRNQMQMIRFGDLLGVRYDIVGKGGDFEVFNVAEDPRQLTNLTGTGPAMQEFQTRLQDASRSMRRPDSEARRPYDPFPLSAVTPGTCAPGLAWSAVPSAAPWVPRVEIAVPVAMGICEQPSLSVVPGDRQSSAVLFAGFIDVPADGQYTFHLRAPGGALLRIHEATVIDADCGGPRGSEVSEMIRLKAGKHPWRLYAMTAAERVPELTLEWTPVNGSRGKIPAAAFSHQP